MKFINFMILIYFVVFMSACSKSSNSTFSDENSSINTIVISAAQGIVNQSSPAGTEVCKVVVTQEGASAVSEMKLYGINATYFDIDKDGSITLSSLAQLDSVTRPLFSLEVIATNSTEESNREVVEISIVNTDIPRLDNFNGKVDENATVGSVVGSVTIFDSGDSTINIMTLSGEDASHFSIDAEGLITISRTAALDFNQKNLYTLEVIANNNSGNSLKKEVIITLNKSNNVGTNQLALLLIAISFNDYRITDSEVNWHKKIFGYSFGQINHYYREVSSGMFSLIPAEDTSGVTNDGIIKVNFDMDHPSNNVMDSTHLIDAINLADSFIDFSIYDKNANGNIEVDELQIMFIVGGGETAFGDPVAHSVWAHASGVANPPTVDGVTVMDYFNDGGYSRFGEMQGDHLATIGVIVHELGHAMLGLPDLYDRDQSSGGIGYFGLMASGSWSSKFGESSGSTPVHMCAWSKMEAGWISPQVVTTTTNNIDLHASHSNKYNIIKVPTDDVNQYFLVENRSPIGYDAGMYKLDYEDFSGGVAIWHIDEAQRSSQNDDETHKLVDLEEANDANLDSGGSGTKTNLFYSSNSTLFNNSSTPNSKKYDGSATNISINNISVVGSAGDEYIMQIDITK